MGHAGADTLVALADAWARLQGLRAPTSGDEAADLMGKLQTAAIIWARKREQSRSGWTHASQAEYDAGVNRSVLGRCRVTGHGLACR
eukprot:2622033-Rhodomonas_salina.1